MKKYLLLLFRAAQLLISNFKKDRSNPSLRVSKITTSKGLTIGGLEYFLLNKNIILYIDINKDSKKSATYTLREAFTVSEGTGNVILSGSIEKNITAKFLQLNYTPTRNTPIQLEIDITSGSTIICRYKVILVKQMDFIDEESVKWVDNYQKIHLNIQADIILGKRLAEHLKDVDVAVEEIDKWIKHNHQNNLSTDTLKKMRDDLLIFRDQIYTSMNEN